MTKTGYIADKITKHPATVIVSAIVGFVQIVLWILELLGYLKRPGLLTTLGQIALYILAALCVFVFYRVFNENRRLKESYAKIHDLNHCYRQTLAETSLALLSLPAGDKTDVKERLLHIEKETLGKALAIISDIYEHLLAHEVVATVWLFDPQAKTVEEYVNSHDGRKSTRSVRRGVPLHIDKNTRFCECKTIKDKFCHYHSPDLIETGNTKEGYDDLVPHYIDHYKSVLVVPIRFRVEEAGEEKYEDRLGFLQLDTMSRYQLNDAEHLALLAAFADQIYNFMSLVRRNYMFA